MPSQIEEKKRSIYPIRNEEHAEITAELVQLQEFAVSDEVILEEEELWENPDEAFGESEAETFWAVMSHGLEHWLKTTPLSQRTSWRLIGRPTSRATQFHHKHAAKLQTVENIRTQQRRIDEMFANYQKTLQSQKSVLNISGMIYVISSICY